MLERCSKRKQVVLINLNEDEGERKEIEDGGGSRTDEELESIAIS